MDSKTLTIDGTEIPYNAKYAQFIEDMEEAGLDVEYYRGKGFYEGPAVRVDDLQDALSNTKIKCCWDNLGLRWIVYPK